MTDQALYYALSTIAQCAAALAALIGFLGLWRLDRLKQERDQDERDLRGLLYRARYPSEEAAIVPTDDLIKMARSFSAADTDQAAIGHSGLVIDEVRRRQTRVTGILGRWDARQNKQKWLMRALRVFLVVTLVGTLAPAIVGIVHVDWLKTRTWTPTLLYVASALLAIAPTWVVLMAARSTRAVLTMALLLALASPALAAPVRCTTYEEQTLGRLQTLCDDSTRAVSRYNRTLDRWETTITSSPRRACTGRMHPVTRQVEVRCR
jgi:hypothetical protein